MEPKRPKIGVGVFVRKDDHILMINRKGSHGDGTWGCPGGHLEWNEDFEETARREVKEETNVDVKNIRFAGLTNDKFKEEEKHYLTVWVECEYLAGEARSNKESREVQWVHKDNLPSPLFLPLENWLAGKKYP